MCTIRPFRAVRYATKPGERDVSSRIAPPYDVLDQSGKQALLDRDPRNFVLIDLPYVPAKAAGPSEGYDAAANQLRTWVEDGTMVRDAQPAIYVYHQAYRHDGAEHVRKMFFARLRLEEFGSGNVLPHEQTFGGPKEDRLCLTQATRANLSPIFGLYHDAANEVSRRLEPALNSEPLATGKLEDVENRLWAVSDPRIVSDVAELLAQRPVYIADGHHRYGTSLLYRKWLGEREGALADDHPANFTLMVLCAMEDAGLLILPTHRVLPGLSISREFLERDGRIEVQPIDAGRPEQLGRELARFGPQAVGLWSAVAGGVALRPKYEYMLREFDTSHSDAWRRLALAFLHAYLIDRRVVPELCAGHPPVIHYVKSAGDALAEARDSNGSVFLMQSTTMEELRAVCDAGDLMPQKSTYFFPKLASGLVVNPMWE